MSDPRPFADPDDRAQAAAPQLRRPHPLTVLVRGWAGFLGLGYVIIKNEDLRDLLVKPERWAELGWTIPTAVVAGILLLLGLLGWATWYFTRFVIDAHEVRIETGWLSKRSRQVAVDRIQSVDVIQTLFPRLLGLAEVKIDVGADAATRLRYLSRSDAYAVRDLLLAHAHGQSAPDATNATVLTLDVWQDKAVDEDVLVTVPPMRLVVSAICSTEMLATVLVLFVPLGIGWFTGQAFVGLGFMVPVLYGMYSIISGRVLKQFHYRLAHGPRGLKISRGLLDLTTQSVPVHRIQGLTVTQPLLWQALGYYRVDVEVLGYGKATADEDSSDTSTILLPAGTARDVATVLHACLPGLDLRSVTMHGVDPRHRWFHPIAWKGTRYGVSDQHLITESGVWSLRMHIAPHSRIQSVEVSSGPLERRLGVASATLHGANGDASVPHLSADIAERFAFEELDRATTARRREIATLDRLA